MPPIGTVFEIKRFAVHDGPGVRTALFLKGCSLRCRWCHNPEGIEPAPQLAYYDHKCLHCGECVGVCPHGAHDVIEGRHVFDRTKCLACGACADVCLGRALKLFGRQLTVEDARRIVLEDRVFYADGGGVTLSGGEPLLQAQFCAELFKQLKAENIHCAIDTSGAVSWKSVETVLPFTDMFLYDVKHVDDELHRKYVGQPNHQIIENLKRLATCGVPIEIRIPVIPGFNDDLKSIDAIGQLLGELPNLAGVRLLAYHEAPSKFEAVDFPNDMPHVVGPSKSQMAEIAAQLQECMESSTSKTPPVQYL